MKQLYTYVILLGGPFSKVLHMYTYRLKVQTSDYTALSGHAKVSVSHDMHTLMIRLHRHAHRLHRIHNIHCASLQGVQVYTYYGKPNCGLA